MNGANYCVVDSSGGLVISDSNNFLPGGIDQIDFAIPAGVPSGAAPVVVTMGNASTTKTVTVAVQ